MQTLSLCFQKNSDIFFYSFQSFASVGETQSIFIHWGNNFPKSNLHRMLKENIRFISFFMSGDDCGLSLIFRGETQLLSV